MNLISVIVPNFNHEKYLRQRLTSIFNQTYSNIEVIFLDDASTDDSVKILSKYENHPKVSHFIINNENSNSPFKQWKKGIELARGDFIWIAESDDYISLEFLDHALDSFAKNTEQVIFFVKSKIIDNLGKAISNYNYSSIGFDDKRWDMDFTISGIEEIENFLIKRNSIPNASAVLFKRDAIPKKLDFLNNFRLLGDWVLWIKILEKGQLHYKSDLFNYFRSSENNTRKQNSPEKKFLRFLEEVMLRKYLLKKQIIKKHSYSFFLKRGICNFIKSSGMKNCLLFFKYSSIHVFTLKEYFLFIKIFISRLLTKYAR